MIGKRLELTLLFLIVSVSVMGQGKITPDSVEFLGAKFKIPVGCKSNYGGQVLCDSYAVSWMYEQASDMERHKRESKAQLKKPKELDCYVLGTRMTAYKAKFEPGIQIVADGVVNGQGVLLHLWFDRKDIKTNDDIPDFVKNFFKLATD